MYRGHGFSLIELLIASTIGMAVAAAVFAIAGPAQSAFDTELAAADMQQRVRVSADTLTRDLTMAGAGAYVGGRKGPLVHYFAPVLPFHQGNADDAPGTFRTDTISLISVPVTAAQTTLAADLLPGALTLQLAAGPGCPPGIMLCGFAVGMTMLVYDETGNVDLFEIDTVDAAAGQLTLASRPLDSAATTYPHGSNVVEARLHTYYLKANAAAQTFQLMHADGSSNAAQPVVDHVVGLAFSYDGEPRAPTLNASGDASYGPAPPALGIQNTAYPAGENCTFRVDEVSGLQVPRLPALAADSALVPLPSAQLVDGPWCPDETNANRWDADLLRIRRVGVTIRIEAALTALRGPAGVLFANAGSSRNPARWAPDLEVHFQLSPPNMNLERE